MKELFIRYLALSISCIPMALILFFIKAFIKNIVSKKWQYYVWTIVIIWLLIPYAPKIRITNQLFQNVEKSIAVQKEMSNIQSLPTMPEESSDNYQDTQVTENTIQVKADIPDYWNIVWNLVWNNAWVLWIGIAFLVFLYKVINYWQYIRYINSGKVVVKDPEALRILQNVCNEVAINKVELSMYTSYKVISPMLAGIIRPFIVLPDIGMDEADLRNILTHELIHLKRRDILYKWIVQLVACLHWFNPMIYIIRNDINKNCELSCDEAIIKRMDADGKKQYGNTLLSSVRIYRESVKTDISLSLNKDAKLLKERLNSIMTFKIRTKFTTLITILLTVAIFSCSMLMNNSAMAAISDSTIDETLPLQITAQSISTTTETIKAPKDKIHPDNKQLTKIDRNKITDIKLTIDTAVVCLKTTNENTFRVCYTGGANKSYKVSAEVTGTAKDMLNVKINGKQQKITSMADLTELDSVILEIPDKKYSNISIEDTNGNLNICEMNAPVTVSDKNGIVTFEKSKLKRGSYALKTNHGIINVGLGTLLTQMKIENTNGIININFSKEPKPGNFLLYVEDEQGSVTLPTDWKKYITNKAGDLKTSPSLAIYNHSGFINVILDKKSKADINLMKMANIMNEKYYLIETEEDLRAIGSGSYSLDDNYMLNKDITLKKEWKAIGDEDHPFTGKFEGNGFTISNLTITDKKAKYIGLFGYAEGATIHNVTLTNVDIDSAGGKGRSIGPIVAIALDSDVSDCHLK